MVGVWYAENMRYAEFTEAGGCGLFPEVNIYGVMTAEPGNLSCLLFFQWL
jgi:hypothetical protein